MSRGVVAGVEQGRAERVTVLTLERVARPLRARVVCQLDWDGPALDRLLDERHASLVEATIGLLGVAGWETLPEASFSLAGERGSIDILAWHPAYRALLVVEVKSTIADVQRTLFVLDRKLRLAPRVGTDRGWTSSSVSKLLVVNDDRTSRRRVGTHRAIFGSTFPARGWACRRWLRAPEAHDRPLAGLLFLTPESQAVTRQRCRRP